MAASDNYSSYNNEQYSGSAGGDASTANIGQPGSELEELAKLQGFGKIMLSCDICQITFNTQVILDAHLAGAKHQKKVKSDELMKELCQTEDSFETEEDGTMRCVICDLVLNSPHLLASHVQGNKHKARVAKRDAGEPLPPVGPPKKKKKGGNANEEPLGISVASNYGYQNPGNSNGSEFRRPITDIPDYVSFVEENKAGGMYICNPCGAKCNSEHQIYQHLTSKKHLAKIEGPKVPPPQPPSSNPSRGGWNGSSSRGKPGLGSGSRASSSSRGSSSVVSVGGGRGRGRQQSSQSDYSDYTETPYYGEDLGYGAEAAYGTEAGYGGDSSYSNVGGYGTTPSFGNNQSYPATPNYGSTASFSSTQTFGTTQSFGSAGSYPPARPGPPGPPMLPPRAYTQPLSQNFLAGGNLY